MQFRYHCIGIPAQQQILICSITKLYKLIGENVENAFRIDESSGLLYATVKQLDFEKNQQIYFKGKGIGGFPRRTSVSNVNVYILNVNKHNNVEKYEYSVFENTPDGVNVGDPIKAIDPDDDEIITYKLESSGVPFSLGSASGQLVVKNSNRLLSNFENSDLDGWSWCYCSCGSRGNICGGYGQKGKDATIEKTFTGLVAGTIYDLTLDLLAVDSWDGEVAKISINGVRVDQQKDLLEKGNDVCGTGSNKIWKIQGKCKMQYQSYQKQCSG